jgi:AraC family transcriptional regulator
MSQPLQSRIELEETATGHVIPSAQGGSVLLSSVEAGWRGITVELHRLPPMEMPEHVLRGHRLVALAESPVEMEWKRGRTWGRGTLGPDTFSLQDNGDTNAPRWREPFTFLAIALEPDFVARAFRDALPSEHFGFAERRCWQDPVVAKFAAHFRRELEAKSYEGALYGESMAVAFASHLLEHHGRGFNGRPLAPKGRLSGAQIRATLELMHGCLGDDLSLDDLARAAHLSPFHFARAWKNSLGASPYASLLRLRIERAKRWLAVPAPPDIKLDITRVAMECGFADAAHFSNAFKRAVGVSPREFARQSR